MANSPEVERKDFVGKVKNEKMRVYLGNHWNNEVHNPLQYADHII